MKSLLAILLMFVFNKSMAQNLPETFVDLREMDPSIKICPDGGVVFWQKNPLS